MMTGQFYTRAKNGWGKRKLAAAVWKGSRHSWVRSGRLGWKPEKESGAKMSNRCAVVGSMLLPPAFAMNYLLRNASRPGGWLAGSISFFTLSCSGYPPPSVCYMVRRFSQRIF
jgi:hypothetical protein